MFDFDINWYLIASHLLDLSLAYVLALPVAWDREKNERSAGLRTFPLTAVAACGYALTALNVFPSPEAQAKVIEGLITGIGFIGGGAILKSRMQITGTATAAGLWATGVIGLSVAYGRLEIAIVMSGVTFFTFFVLGDLKSRVRNSDKSESAD